ncbi:MAG: DUF6242 domain-containing protein [Candidatus Limisoma sp.]|nr:DUF6242 domain-containing protein [Candidatus Limisoma sp.]
MRKLFPIYAILTVIAVLAGVSCNSSDDSDKEPFVIPTSTLVKEFVLQENDSVLVDLDSVFFTVDTREKIIYNADSLPKGTKINRLVATITVTDYATKNIMISGAETMADTTFVHTNAETDTIDFTGNVRLEVVAADGESKATYVVKVNVHKMDPDSLYWNALARRQLPGRSNDIQEQKTAQMGGKTFCLLSELGGYTLSSTENIGGDAWEKRVVTFAFEPIVETFAATDRALAVIGEASGKRTIYYSTDEGATWTDTGVEATQIIGGYIDRVVYLTVESGTYYTATLVPGSEPTNINEVESDFPVRGFSQAVTLTNDWSYEPEILIAGGRDAKGKLTGSVWGFDGKNWGKVSRGEFPPVYGTTLFRYFYNMGEFYNKEQYPVWFAMGGLDNEEKPTKTVYISYDNGVTWKKGDDLVQLPFYFPDFYGAQAFVEATTMTRSAGAWTSMESRKLPRWWQIAAPATRASEPITSWDCPYIYVFGGKTVNGGTHNSIWRGVLNRLSFKPII